MVNFRVNFFFIEQLFGFSPINKVGPFEIDIFLPETSIDKEQFHDLRELDDISFKKNIQIVSKFLLLNILFDFLCL
jgi:hypothetical protein